MLQRAHKLLVDSPLFRSHDCVSFIFLTWYRSRIAIHESGGIYGVPLSNVKECRCNV